jgi:hypothetical protein
MEKLKGFAYVSEAQLSSQLHPQLHSQDEDVDEGEEAEQNPATPMPQRISLSDLISSTPITKQENGQDISPEDKIVWKLSPKRLLQTPPSQDSPNAKMTKFMGFLQDENVQKSVYQLFSLVDLRF